MEYKIGEFEEHEDDLAEKFNVSTVCDKLSRATGLDEIAAPASCIYSSK